MLHISISSYIANYIYEANIIICLIEFTLTFNKHNLALISCQKKKLGFGMFIVNIK